MRGQATLGHSPKGPQSRPDRSELCISVVVNGSLSSAPGIATYSIMQKASNWTFQIKTNTITLKRMHFLARLLPYLSAAFAKLWKRGQWAETPPVAGPRAPTAASEAVHSPALTFPPPLIPLAFSCVRDLEKFVPTKVVTH